MDRTTNQRSSKRRHVRRQRPSRRILQNNAGITVWSRGNQLAARITSAIGLSNDPVMYDAMATMRHTFRPMVVAGHLTQGGAGGYTVYGRRILCRPYVGPGDPMSWTSSDASGNLISPSWRSDCNHVDRWAPATGTAVLADDIQLTSGRLLDGGKRLHLVRSHLRNHRRFQQREPVLQPYWSAPSPRTVHWRGPEATCSPEVDVSDMELG